MNHRSTILLCSLTATCGFIAGSAIETKPLATPAHAHALNTAEANRLQQDLDSDSNALVRGSRLLAKVAKLVTPSVVHIQSERNSINRGKIEETGSGVLIENSAPAGMYIITNGHVVQEAELNDISIHLQDGRVLKPQRVWTDRATDVAALKVTAADLHPARWGNSKDVEIGHMVLAMGSPFGLSQSVTYGIISAKGRRSLRLGERGAVLNQDFLQTDAAINPGNSGGPLIDLSGRVIGINTAIASNSGGNDGIGFSIPSNLARRVVEQLLQNGKVERAYLGVKLDAEFNEQTARRLKLDRVRGARVMEVYAKTPASRAELKFDDVVLSMNGTPVLDENHLINLISLTPVGETVRLEVFREGQTLTIQVILADRSELEQRSMIPGRPGLENTFELM